VRDVFSLPRDQCAHVISWKLSIERQCQHRSLDRQRAATRRQRDHFDVRFRGERSMPAAPTRFLSSMKSTISAVASTAAGSSLQRRRWCRCRQGARGCGTVTRT